MSQFPKRLAICLGAFLLLWIGLRFFLPLTLPFLLGTGLALAAEPLTGLLCRRCRLPRPLAAGIGVTAAFTAIGILLFLLCAFLLRELQLVAQALPRLEQTASEGIGLLRSRLMDLAARAPGSLGSLLERNILRLFSDGTALLEGLGGYILSLAGGLLTRVPESAFSLGTGVISGYMICAKLPKIRRWIRRRFRRDRLRPVLETLGRLRRALGGYLLAQLKLMGVTFLLLLPGLLLLRIPQALAWAGAICLVDAFPVLGTGAVLIPWSLFSFLQADPGRGLGLLALYGLIQLVRTVLEPRLVGKQLGLDPLVTLMALYAGYKLWGLPGMLLAPLAAVTAAQLASPGPSS